MNTSDTQAAVERVVHFFEHLQPGDLTQLARLYTADARFKDPFNDVQGLPAITPIFAHMFVALENPRFVVTGRVVQGRQCFLLWDFLFAFKNHCRGVTQTVRGTSHLVFDDSGAIVLHRDYWDAAEELYEKLPLVGRLMRWLKRRVSAP